MPKNPKLFWYIVILIMLFTLGYRIKKAPSYPYYEDEVLSIMAANGLKEHGVKLLSGDKLYRWNILAHSLLAIPIHFWGTNEYSTRLVSIIASVLLLPLVFVMGRKLYNPWVGLLAVIFLSILSYEHQFAISARYYSLLQFFFTLCVFCFYRGFIEGRNGYKVWAILSFVLALLTQIIILEILPAFLIFLFIVYGWQWLKDEYTLIGIVVALAVIYFVIFFKFPAQSPNLSVAPPMGVNLANLPWGSPKLGSKLRFIKFLNLNPTHGIAGVILSLLYLIRERKRQLGLYQLVFWTGLVGVSLVTHHDSAIRYIYNLYPIYILLLSYVLVRTGQFTWKYYKEHLFPKFKTWPRTRIWQTSMVLGLSFPFLLGGTFNNQIGSKTRPPNIKPAHLYVKQHAQPGEIIASSNIWLTEIYLREPDYFLREYKKVGGKWADRYIDSVAKLQKLMSQEQKGIWIIADHKFYTYSGDELRNYIKRKFQIYYSSRKNQVAVYYWSPHKN